MANMLGESLSPYLQQHRDNPVHWVEWNEAAFDKAKSEKKPVFISIGYATCHWCHVMAHESFEDEETAKYLNENFICIKVDREIRPDIDDWLMDYVQRTTGHGGWPMSVFLTPEKNPFFGGTYFPKEQKYGMPSFMDVLSAIKEKFDEGIDVKDLPRLRLPKEEVDADTDIIARSLLEDYDTDHKGFGKGTKFPPWSALLYMLRHVRRTKRKDLEKALFDTLEKMMTSGLYDHIGGGFHRYCVDRSWTVPHFEKMLYDQAMAIWVYSEAFALSKKKTQQAAFRRVIEETIDYLQRETREECGYASALDADTDGVEGKYYVYTEDELKSFLSADEIKEVKEIFDLPEGGNFEGNYVLNRQKALPANIKKKFSEFRLTRMQKPFLDTKVLVAWNGMVGHALCMAARYVDPNIIIVAEELHQKLVNLTEEDKEYNVITVNRFAKGAVSTQLGFLEDHAWFGLFSLSLYEATGQGIYMNYARLMQTTIENLFWREELLDVSPEHEAIPSEHAEMVDHPFPSSTSATLYLHARISKITGQLPLNAEKLLRRTSPLPMQSPEHYGFLASLLEELHHPMLKGAVHTSFYAPTYVRDPLSSPLQLCVGTECRKYPSAEDIRAEIEYQILHPKKEE